MRYMTALVLTALSATAIACGDGSSFPEPAVCGEAPALPTSRATPGTVSGRTYERALEDGVRRLQLHVDDFKGKYPSGNFSRSNEFRVDFADYSDRTRCLATYLRDLAPPDAGLEGPDMAFDTAIDDLLAHTEFGREAVRRRNVSEWRQWRDGVDAKLNALRNALRAIDT